jgi:hypothetical protein
LGLEVLAGIGSEDDVAGIEDDENGIEEDNDSN